MLVGWELRPLPLLIVLQTSLCLSPDIGTFHNYTLRIGRKTLNVVSPGIDSTSILP